ncbi:hypothetical protein, partial [Pseudoflavonifractor phocaeensis]|uniref:hypothetical protein n=1 Tax=Pseudoflavonifractor phocaeensis TaxID=1870988 RepID=UPI00195E6A36
MKYGKPLEQNGFRDFEWNAMLYVFDEHKYFKYFVHQGAVDKRFTRGENHGRISAYGGGKMQLKFHMVTIEDL